MYVWEVLSDFVYPPLNLSPPRRRLPFTWVSVRTSSSALKKALLISFVSLRARGVYHQLSLPSMQWKFECHRRGEYRR